LAITEPPGLCREDADFELVGGKTQFVSPSKHDLEVAHIGRDGPPELVERQTGVLAEPTRYEPVEDKAGWLLVAEQKYRNLVPNAGPRYGSLAMPWSPRHAYPSTGRPSTAVPAAA
jgi:hypothetical protein